MANKRKLKLAATNITVRHSLTTEMIFSEATLIVQHYPLTNHITGINARIPVML
jgi:hypothetical protein